MRTIWTLPIGVALALSATTAAADQPKTVASAAASAAPAVSGSAAAPTAAAPAASPEERESRSKRAAYVRTTRAKIRETVRANNKEVTHEERTVIGLHWRHTMRVFRVREMAAKAKDAASIARCDALVTKADEKFFAKLKELNAKAPERKPGADGGAPKKGDGEHGEGRGHGGGHGGGRGREGDKH